MIHLSEPIKDALDVLALVFAFLTWLTSILPALASAASLVWACIRIYEWLKGRKNGNVRLD